MQLDDVDIIHAHIKKSIIVTCRIDSSDLRGGFDAGIELHNKIVQRFIDLGVGFIDLDIRTLQQSSLQMKQTLLICSYHDFVGGASMTDLCSLFNQMRHFEPFLYKFACRANSMTQFQDLFAFMLDKIRNHSMVVIGMGNQAKFTRVLGPKLGSYFSFVASDRGASAPGQLTATQYKTLFNELL